MSASAPAVDLDTASREDGIGAPVMVPAPFTMDASRHEVMWAGGQVSLSSTEYLVLHALAQWQGIVVSRNQLLGVVGDTKSSDRAIDGHIKRIRNKMREVDDGFLAIKMVYGVGYRYSAHMKRP